MFNSKMRCAIAVRCFVLVFLASPLYAQKVGTGAFPDTSLIEKQLQRGVSTMTDVQRLLGVPNGTGHGDMARPPATGAPPMGDGPRGIWYYDDIEITDMKSSAGRINMNLRQQILLIFFKGDVFDGYLWTSNVLAPTVY